MDQIKTGPVSAGNISRTELRVATVARVAAPARAAPEAAVPEPTIAKRLAAAPPVDTDRVAVIKQAIANGTFPITPARIADQLIALKLQWTSNEPA